MNSVSHYIMDFIIIKYNVFQAYICIPVLQIYQNKTSKHMCTLQV